MDEWSDSFGECHLKTLIFSPCSTSQSWSRIFKAVSSCCLISISSFFLPFRPLPVHHGSSDLTSLAISCLLLEPRWSYCHTSDTQVLHHSVNIQLSLVIKFFPLKGYLVGWLPMPARQQHTRNNKIENTFTACIQLYNFLSLLSYLGFQMHFETQAFT